MRPPPLSTPPPIAPTKSSRPRTLSSTTCYCQPGVCRDIARTTNGAYAPTMISPIPAGHAKAPGNKPNDMRTRNITPISRHPCIAVNRRRSRLSESVRTFLDDEYAEANKIGGPITAISKARGVWSGFENTPIMFTTSAITAQIPTTSQTAQLLVSVFVMSFNSSAYPSLKLLK